MLVERTLHKEYGYSYSSSPSIGELTQREIDRLMMASQIDNYIKDYYQRKQLEERDGKARTLTEGRKKALRRAEKKIEEEGSVLGG